MLFRSDFYSLIFITKTLGRNDGLWTEQAMRMSLEGTRAQGRPRKRWSDDSTTYLNMIPTGTDKALSWTEWARASVPWNKLQDGFVSRQWAPRLFFYGQGHSTIPGTPGIATVCFSNRVGVSGLYSKVVLLLFLLFLLYLN